MYSYVDFGRCKIVLNKIKIVLSFLFLSFFLTPVFASAVPKPTPEDVARLILSHNPASNDWKMENVSARAGQVSGDLTQRAAANGSMYQAVEHVAVPANTAEVAKVALDVAKKLAKIGGGLGVGLAAQYGIDKLLQGVGYVMGPGAVVKKSDGTLTDPKNYKGHYIFRVNDKQFTDINVAGQAFCDDLKNIYGWYHVAFTKGTPGEGNYSANVVCAIQTNSSADVVMNGFGMSQIVNPNYDPSVPASEADTVPVPSDGSDIPTLAQLMNADTTGKYDPVIQYAYTPKEADGVTPKPATYVDWGVNGFTPEISQNLIDNRNAILQADITQNNLNALNTAVKDPTQTGQQTIPDGHSQSTTTKPDGTKITTSTDTVTDPKTGQQTTTTTVTTTKPDGTTSTEQTNTTADNIKTKTDLPAVCDYFSKMCDWLDWTQKDEPQDKDPDTPEISQMDMPKLDTSTFKATAGCPPDINVPIQFINTSQSVAITYMPLCEFAKKWSFVAPMIGFLSGAMIIIGVGRKGEDSDA